jgi:2-polyprenyl-3-methyl-5-hydroxy-6-metoxy-1,4-benzoquinol methylase
MKQFHWRVTGIDLYSPHVGRNEPEEIRLLAGTLPHPALSPNSFDVITMWHSLEHVPAPRHLLEEARKLLTWNGKLVVAVPNLDSLGFRIFRSHWCGLDLPRHLTHFTSWTLQLMLERCGFRVESVQMQTHSGWLRRSSLYANSDPCSRALQRWLSGKLLSRLAASYAGWTRQADAIVVTSTPAIQG